MMPERAELDYQPKNTVAVQTPIQKRVEDLLEALDDDEDVQDVYANVAFPS